jgi:hypothetical protein
MTTLPGAEKAIVDPAKVRDYLLSSAHPVGRFEARFFEALGYTANAWQTLQDDLLLLAATGESALSRANQYGEKYEVVGSLVGPNGRTGRIVSIWMVRDNDDAPRFVTAYPG